MLNRIAQAVRSLFSPASRRAQSAGRRVVARYDAAADTEENRNHWKNADYLDAMLANSPEVRRKLRSRSRYEAHESNSYLKGMVRTLAQDTIGKTPRVQVRTNNPDADRIIEKAFSKWMTEVRLAKKLRTMRKAWCVDGESFAIMTTAINMQGPVKLGVRLVEADQIATPNLSYFGSSNAVDGIRFDADGEPAAYHLLKYHPGSSQASFGEYVEVPAKFVVHLFSQDRPGQWRGVPEITPALPLFAQVRRFTLSVLSASETAAKHAAVVYTDAPALDQVAAVEPLDIIDLPNNAALTMPEGWKIGQLKAEQPTTTYDGFVKSIINEAARCINMPLNVATCNSSSYNYSSGRLDHQVYRKSIDVDRFDLATDCMDRFLAAWGEEARRVNGLIPADVSPLADWDVEWHWDGFEDTDVANEASARAERLATGQTTHAEEDAKRGVNWEEKFQQQAKEEAARVAIRRSFGLPDYPPTMQPNGQQQQPQQPPQNQPSDQQENAGSAA